MSHNIVDLKRQFLEYLEIEKGRSLNTIENYNRYISRFISFAKISEPREITRDLVRSYRLWLNRQEGRKGQTLSKNTQNYHVIALRSFLKYMTREGITTLEPEKIELLKVEERELDLITEVEFQRLLETTLGTELEEIRDRALINTLFSTGLRISELCSLNDDLNLDVDEFSIRGKGGKVRIIFLSTDAKRTIADYRHARDKAGMNVLSEVLFVSASGKRLYPRAVQRVLSRRAIQAGITKHVTPHTIRHYFATDLLKKGADIRSVQMLLGHASINTTQIYTNLSDKHLKEVHRRFHN